MTTVDVNSSLSSIKENQCSITKGDLTAWKYPARVVPLEVSERVVESSVPEFPFSEKLMTLLLSHPRLHLSSGDPGRKKSILRSSPIP
jgi:hypothetical protein